jgi:hypothetical protein
MKNINDIIIILTYFIGIALVLWYLFGDSPTLEQVIIGLLLINMGWTYKLSNKVSYHLGEHSGKD